MQRISTRDVILRSAIAYGVGFVVGTLFLLIVLNNNVARGLTAALFGEWQILLRLVLGLLIILLFFGLSGGFAGAIGGYFSWVPRFDDEEEDKRARRKFTWRTAWSLFATHAILIVPLLVVTVIVGFLNPDLDVNLLRLPQLFLTYGLLYGLIAGFFLGWLTAGLRQIIGPWLAAIVGFGIGGLLFGFGANLYLNTRSLGGLVSALIILISIFIFGAFGGGLVSYALHNVRRHKSIFPDKRSWHILRNAALVIIAIFFLSALVKLVQTLTIRPASLEEVLTLPTQGTHWTATNEPLPSSSADLTNGRELQADCTEDGRITISEGGSVIGEIQAAGCLSQPVIAVNANGNLHVVWYSDKATKVTNVITPGDFIFESVLTEAGWTEPTIIARTNGAASPALTAVPDALLGLTWEDNAGNHQAILYDYQCDDVALTPIGQAVFDVVRQEEHWNPADPIPYCHNQFDRILYTPNPTAPEIEGVNNPNAAFDEVAAMVTEAQYEVLFTTMQWDAPSEKGSPGDTMAGAVAELYEKVKANPENYPRGMTVRILLGNLPDLAVFDPTTQIYHTLQDLHDAGVPEMVNEEIGWNLEVADFDGAWPHAHSKFVVVDGKTANAAGFNYSYLHLPVEHPSGQGLDMTDKGIQVTGPVVQQVMAAYDDLWSGSDIFLCSTFPPPVPILDFLWCDEQTAVATHPPEVLRFYLTDDNTNAFSLHHTMNHLESDEAILAALESAQNTIDVYEVNFSLETVCAAALLLAGLCDEESLGPPYLDALVTAVVENDVKVRAIVEPSAFNGFENRMGIAWLTSRLEEEGKLENLEIKFSNNKMHDKAVLIDDQLLIIGSQNFHWSAWDTPSLTEYNIATEDQEAIAEFKTEFEHQWEIGIPAME